MLVNAEDLIKHDYKKNVQTTCSMLSATGYLDKTRSIVTNKKTAFSNLL